ncbi:MAG: TetR/AcrR family transcriptional regulator [Sebaldella sp.]|nr:TetR/AcrR family transcriptional regulator [Sebaldella sp.]
MPKVKFDKEEIINTTFEILKNDGIRGISARNIAKKMKSSTAPIYAHFENIAVLKKEVINMAKDVLIKYLEEKYTEKKMLNMAMGVVIFAREQKELFRSIFLIDDDFKSVIERAILKILETSKDDERFEHFDKNETVNLVLKIWYYIHGYATLVCTEFIKNPSDEEIKSKVLEVATIFISNELDKKLMQVY